MNKWLVKHLVLDTNNAQYDERFGGGIFRELIDKVWCNSGVTKEYNRFLAGFGLSGNSKVAHLWLLLNPDKWEVEEDELFYICIPEPDGIDAYLYKDRGFEFSGHLPHAELSKWTQEEIDEHEAAKHLQHFKKKVEK